MDPSPADDETKTRLLKERLFVNLRLLKEALRSKGSSSEHFDKELADELAASGRGNSAVTTAAAAASAAPFLEGIWLVQRALSEHHVLQHQRGAANAQTSNNDRNRSEEMELLPVAGQLVAVRAELEEERARWEAERRTIYATAEATAGARAEARADALAAEAALALAEGMATTRVEEERRKMQAETRVETQAALAEAYGEAERARRAASAAVEREKAARAESAEAARAAGATVRVAQGELFNQAKRMRSSC